MRRRTFEVGTKRYRLEAFGPVEKLDRALDTAEAIVRFRHKDSSAGTGGLAGVVEAEECCVRITWT